MSLRLYARLGDREYQVLGNNEFPQCLADELTKQGAKITVDGCFGYDWDAEDNRQYTFKVKDLNAIIKALEQHIIETEKNYQKRKSFYQKLNGNKNAYTAETIADFSDEVFLHRTGSSLTATVKEIMEFGYIFCSANLLKFIGRTNYELYFAEDDFEYTLKNNVELYMYAY